MSLLSPRTIDETMEGLIQVGAALCAYTIDPARWLTTRCDCKYGGPKGQGEQTGCPELRDVYDHLSRMKRSVDLVTIESRLHAAHAAAAMANQNIGQVRQMLEPALAALKVDTTEEGA